MLRQPLTVALLLTTALVGCAFGGFDSPETWGQVPEELPTNAGHIVAFSRYEASLGSVLDIFVTDVPGGQHGRPRLRFEGVFEPAAGQGESELVDVVVDVERLDGGTLRWGGFGPFRNPWTKDSHYPAKLGHFRGKVAIVFERSDGTILQDSDPLGLSFEVLPSIWVQQCQPLPAFCAEPAKRWLGGVPYRCKVEAVGFEPVTFTYTLAAPAVGFAPLTIRHTVARSADEVGASGDFQLPEVPADLQMYGGVISVTGTTAEGRSYTTSFGVTVHRPIELYYNGNMAIAEVFEPQAVSGCIPGTGNGASVRYVESTSETRQRSTRTSWQQEWLTKHDAAQTAGQMVGWTEQNGVGFSQTQESAFRWYVGSMDGTSQEGGTSVGGEISFNALISAGLGGARSSRSGAQSLLNQEAGGAATNEQTVAEQRTSGLSGSTTTTNVEAVSHMKVGSQGEADEWTVSSTSTVDQTYSTTVYEGQAAVMFRQTVRVLRRMVVVTYNQCGLGEVIGDVDVEDWLWAPGIAVTDGDSCRAEFLRPPTTMLRAGCYLDEQHCVGR